MFRRALPAALVLAQPVFAQDLCPMTGDSGNCVRILACVGDQGRWFQGRAFGRGQGAVAGVMSDGATCVGTWTSRNWMGAGQADVACDDGMEVTVLYTYQDEYTGTARGGGQANSGEWVQVWSGLNLLDYLHAQTGQVLTLPCDFGNIPMS